jgi:DNA helicase II / ATP-dependent DNA helicase PcrA
MVKTDNYDKLEEEKRLFYVAISRAKERLYITHSGKKPTYFINDEMHRIAGEQQQTIEESPQDQSVSAELMSWRNITAAENNAPVYTVLTNKTIEQLSQKLPVTPEDLSKIDGIGPTKLMKYGAKILEIVNEFKETTE